MGFMLLENCCIVAVNLFGLISGWLAEGHLVHLKKLGRLWLQALFWLIVIGAIDCVLSGQFGPSILFGLVTPVLSRRYWYFNAFIVMQLMAWFIAPSLRRLPRSAVASVSLALAVFACSVGFLEGKGANGVATNGGYSSLWLLVLWLCGVSLRLYRKQLRDFFPTRRMVLVAILIPVASLACELYDVATGGNDTRWTTYVSPLVAMQSLALFVLMTRMRISGRRLRIVLPVAAAAAFNVYLIDMHPFVYGTLIKGHFAWANGMGALGVPAVILSSFVMFALFLAMGLSFEWGRAWVRKKLNR